MLKEQIDKAKNLELIKSGSNFLGILNDLKVRPEDAAKALNVSIDEIISIIKGKKSLSQEIINRAVKIWPVNARDFYLVNDDCPNGFKIMRFEDSAKNNRIMERAGKPYYEYRDTVMSTTAPFRPEWIMELCQVENNDPNNPLVQWNNGHFMHQFTYFIGDVNFYYRLPNGEKKVAVMNTGDSMYITPFVPHTFTTRKGTKQNGLILTLTYGNKLTGDIQHELSAISPELGSEFALDFSTKPSAFASLFKYHKEISSLTIEEISKRTKITTEKLREFESGKSVPLMFEFEVIADALNINIRDLMPPDEIEEKVIVLYHEHCKKWYYHDSTKSYEFTELASSKTLPYSKALEINVLDSDNQDLDLRVGLYQYIYNIGDTKVKVNWNFNNKNYQEIVNPGDSVYLKPFVKHNFRGSGKLLILRIGGKITGDPQLELSCVGKNNAKRAISENVMWFDPEGKN